MFLPRLYARLRSERDTEGLRRVRFFPTPQFVLEMLEIFYNSPP